MTRDVLLRRALIALGAIAVAGGAFGAGTWFGAEQVRARNEWAEGRLLSTAIDSVRANAIDSLPSDELIRRAVAGMLRELHDPYAAMLRPDGYQKYRGTLQGDGTGLGFTMRKQLGEVTVSRVASGSPAANAGARAGDRVLSVNGVPIDSGWGGKSGADSTLQVTHVNVVRPPHGDTVQLEVRRGVWHTRAVTDISLLTDSVGYVRLTSITSRSSAELEQAVDSLRERGARSLVLDLRGNSGGLFDEGVKAAGLFLPRGVRVASLDGRRGAKPEEYTNHNSRWPTMPLTLLVDAGTASAAEVIAAALRDHQRALLVGTPTYGKGVVQRVVTLTKDISLRLTTARWHTPNGETLQRREGIGAAAHGGMQPDILLDDAGRRDPFSVPRDWPARAVSEVSAAADSASLLALREQWAVAPVAVLEARLRNLVSAQVPRAVRGDASRASWVNVATRLATVRVLQIAAPVTDLLRYSVRDDAALRAGLEVVAPGSDLLRVLPTMPAGTATNVPNATR